MSEDVRRMVGRMCGGYGRAAGLSQAELAARGRAARGVEHHQALDGGALMQRLMAEPQQASGALLRAVTVPGTGLQRISAAALDRARPVWLAR